MPANSISGFSLRRRCRLDHCQRPNHRIDTSEALRVEGVLDILTHENRPPMARPTKPTRTMWPRKRSPFRPLHDDKINFNGQPIALVLAKSARLRAMPPPWFASNTSRKPIETDLKRSGTRRASEPREARYNRAATAAKAFATAAAIEAEYHPDGTSQSNGTVRDDGHWHDGGNLTVYDKTQGPQNNQQYVCSVFELPPDKVRVLVPFVGGAFGSGLRPQYQLFLAVMAASG